MRRRRLAARAGLGVLLAVILGSWTSCDEEATPATTTAPSGARTMIGGVPVGTVEGVVRLAEGDDEPSYPSSPFDTPSAGTLPDSCTPPQTRDRRPLAMSADRGLANVGVAATGDPEHWIGPGDPIAHEIRIHDCRLDPVTITATVGDTMRVTSDMTFPFMPRVAPGMLQAVLPSDPLEAPIDRAGPRTIACEFTAPCGRVELLAFHTPVHAVTGVEGHFRIENAPADQELTITAWHPLVVAGTATTRVTEGGTSHVEIVVHRVAPPPPTTAITPGSVDPPSIAPASTTTPPQ
jgi:hypothetical protein